MAKKQQSKPGVMIYFETGKAIRKLDYEKKGRLFEAIMDYAEFGIEPDLDDGLALAWPFIANAIDRDSQSYAKTVVGRKKAAYAKWWPAYAAENGLDPQDKTAKERWIDEQMAKEAKEAETNACNDMQMHANDANASFAMQTMQTMPTTTPTPTSTPTSTTTPAPTTTTTPTGTPARVLNAGAKQHAHGRYQNVFLTGEEYTKLLLEVPFVDDVIEKLSEYMKSSGKTYESHDATIRKWAREDAEKAAAAAKNAPTHKTGNVFYDLVQGGKVQ